LNFSVLIGLQLKANILLGHAPCKREQFNYAVQVNIAKIQNLGSDIGGNHGVAIEKCECKGKETPHFEVPL
jgi:hypothetical protein